MKNHWWKALGVFLVLYSLTVGMLVPLKPGIYQVTPSRANVGERVSLEITGYNTSFAKAESSSRAWLKLDNDRALAATNVEVINDIKLKADFQLPSHLPVPEKAHSFTLIIDDEYNGGMASPSALFVTQNTIDTIQGAELWNNATIDNINRFAGMTFPFRNILEETIRNTYYHVSLWFAMVVLFMISVWYSWKYLKTSDLQYDTKAVSFTQVGTLFGLLGCATGALWAKATWGTYWTLEEIKLNMAAIALLIYLAYFILRGSFEAQERKARISAVYNIFAFAALIPLIFVIPRMTEGSLHPGNGGNPGFGGEDLDNTMRMIFYPAIIGWILMGIWMSRLASRIESLKLRLLD